MKLSELISALQATIEEKGDTQEVALCIVVDGQPAHRIDVFGAITVLHDTAQYPQGIAYLVADSFLPDERECCGTFPGTPHRSTCANWRGKNKPSNAALRGDSGHIAGVPIESTVMQRKD